MLPVNNNEFTILSAGDAKKLANNSPIPGFIDGNKIILAISEKIKETATLGGYSISFSFEKREAGFINIIINYLKSKNYHVIESGFSGYINISWVTKEYLDKPHIDKVFHSIPMYYENELQ